MLVCLIGKSGSGKTTLKNELKSKYGYKPVITYTTRSIRPGEVVDIDYHFISLAQFNEMNSQGKFLETAEFGGNYYGTPLQDYAKDNHVAVVELSGYRKIKSIPGQAALGIYLDVPYTERYARLLKECYTEEVGMRLQRDEGKFDGVYSAVDFVLLSRATIEANAQAIDSFKKYVESTTPSLKSKSISPV